MESKRGLLDVGVAILFRVFISNELGSLRKYIL